ncbi:leucine zipper transcription factor-like protein 1 [Dysidea avara]|uniref:leucine zipper transcription factor-like protein 1 n=1 Tax=Dysidea avara TaxID=196820 RepID=UPI0033201D54
MIRLKFGALYDYYRALIGVFLESINMSTKLALSEHHEKAVVDYLKFTRVMRGQCVRSVTSTFEETIDSRLNEGTFTADEVKEMMTGLEAVVRGDVESELLHIDHCSVLLLKQLCSQADKWHLKLQPDISELQNRELLEEIARVEAQVFSEPFKAAKPTSVSLEPLQDIQGTELLRRQLAEVQKENERLTAKLRDMEQVAVIALREKDAQRDKEAASKPPPQVNNEQQVMEVSKLKEEIAKLQQQLEKDKTNNSPNDETREKLISTTHELLKVTSELDRTKEELDKKFGDTAQYNNLKTMLASKNAQLKELRDRLKKYEPDSF